MKILFTRHGQTDWNLNRKIQGSVDIELNDTGIAQAKEVREKLKDTKIDLVISSPLKRAYKTAEIIVGDRKIPLITDQRITERSFGVLEGKEKIDIPGWKERIWKLDLKSGIEGMEEFVDMNKRIREFLDDIIKKYYDKTILVVFHGAVSIPARYYFEPDADKDNLYKLALGNCEVVEYEI